MVYDVSNAPINDTINLNTYFFKNDSDSGDVLGLLFFTKQILPSWLTLIND